MSIDTDLLSGFKDMLQGIEDASALDSFVDNLDESYREALSDEIDARRAELSDMPPVSEATTAEMADYFDSNPEQFEVLAEALQDEDELEQEGDAAAKDADEAGESSNEDTEGGDTSSQESGLELPSFDDDYDEETVLQEIIDYAQGAGIADDLENQLDSVVTDYDSAEYSEGDKVKWSWQGSTVHGKVANVGDSFTVEGNEISGEEGEAVYKLDEWDDDAEEFKSGNVAKPESSLSKSDKNMEQSEDSLDAYAEKQLVDSEEFDEESAKAKVLAQADGLEEAKEAFLVTDESPAGLDVPIATVEDEEVVVSARALETASTRLGQLDLSDEEEQEAIDRLHSIRNAFDIETSQSDDSEKRVKNTLAQALGQLDVDLPVDDAEDADLEMLAAAVRDQSESLSEAAADQSESIEDEEPTPVEMLDRLMTL